MFEKIIVPLDGSKLAEVALPYAGEIAGRLSSDITLIYVKKPQEKYYPRMIQCYLDSVAVRAGAMANSYLEEPGNRSIKIETLILEGNPAEEIVTYADNTEGSNIIMATHGRSGISRWPLGSVTEKVIQATNRPVAVIRGKGPESAMHEKNILRKILAPLDISRGSEPALSYITELASRLRAEVTLLSILRFDYIRPITGYEDKISLTIARARNYLAKIGVFLNNNGIPTRTEIIRTAEEEATEIIKYTEKRYMDVIIMAAYSSSSPLRRVVGSVTNRVLHEGNTPIILVRSKS